MILYIFFIIIYFIISNYIYIYNIDNMNYNDTYILILYYILFDISYFIILILIYPIYSILYNNIIIHIMISIFTIMNHPIDVYQINNQ